MTTLKSKIATQLRRLEYKALWKLAEWAIERSENRFHMSVAMKYSNEGYCHACDFIADNLNHFVWGHSEMGMKQAAEFVEYERKQWEPED